MTIDPGVRDVGVAAWEDDGLLYGAWLVRSKREGWNALPHKIVECVEGTFLDIDEIVVEVPQVYVQRKLKGDPNDLIMVAVSAGAMAMALQNQYEEARIHLLRPSDWKGQTPKDISIERIKAQLTLYEQSRVSLPSAKTLQHNVWDAVGIGLHWHRRKRGK